MLLWETLISATTFLGIIRALLGTKILVSGSKNEELHFWELEKQQILHFLDFRECENTIFSGKPTIYTFRELKTDSNLLLLQFFFASEWPVALDALDLTIVGMDQLVTVDMLKLVLKKIIFLYFYPYAQSHKTFWEYICSHFL